MAEQWGWSQVAGSAGAAAAGGAAGYAQGGYAGAVIGAASAFVGYANAHNAEGTLTERSSGGPIPAVQAPGVNGGVTLWTSQAARGFNGQTVNLDASYDEAAGGVLSLRARGYLQPDNAPQAAPRLILSSVQNPDLAAAILLDFFTRAGIPDQLPAVDCAFWGQVYARRPRFPARTAVVLDSTNQPNAQLQGLAAACRNPLVIWTWVLGAGAVTDQPPAAPTSVLCALWIAHPELRAGVAGATGPAGAQPKSSTGLFLGLSGAGVAALLAAFALRR